MPSSQSKIKDEREREIAILGGYVTWNNSWWINTKTSLFFYVLSIIILLSSFFLTMEGGSTSDFIKGIMLTFATFLIYYFFESSFFEECYQKGLEIEESQRSERNKKYMQTQKEDEKRRRADEIKVHKAKEDKRKSTLKVIRKYIETGGIKKLKLAIELIEKLEQEKQSGFIFGEAIVGLDEKSGLIKELETEAKTKLAKHHEKLMEFDEAAEIYKELELEDDVIKVRKLKSEQGAVKVTQKVVHGDEVTKTEIKDSVLNRSNIGGKSSKAEELREAKSLLDEGLINEDDYEKMKKEILRK